MAVDQRLHVVGAEHDDDEVERRVRGQHRRQQPRAVAVGVGQMVVEGRGAAVQPSAMTVTRRHRGQPAARSASGRRGDGAPDSRRCSPRSASRRSRGWSSCRASHDGAMPRPKRGFPARPTRQRTNSQCTTIIATLGSSRPPMIGQVALSARAAPAAAKMSRRAGRAASRQGRPAGRSPRQLAALARVAEELRDEEHQRHRRQRRRTVAMKTRMYSSRRIGPHRQDLRDHPAGEGRQEERHAAT